MTRYRDTKRNRQSHNVLRHRSRIAGFGAATGMLIAAAVTPLATAPAAGADLVNTVSRPALFDPPGGNGDGGQGGAGGRGGAGGNGGHGGNG
ncbi:MAG: hypothetical protein WCC28_08990, partial [Mycobacterium sp.]|uniref:hypothetical protein n=1 Tax=Mycobacterium sp. TaxID=1785 RepID=UPI003C75E783